VESSGSEPIDSISAAIADNGRNTSMKSATSCPNAVSVRVALAIAADFKS